MEHSDAQLIENYLGGDDSALEVLFARYLAPVYSFVFGFVHDETIASDLTQDTFVKAWKSIKKFDKQKSFKIWLFAIAKYAVYDQFKKKRTLSFSDINIDDGQFEENIIDPFVEIETAFASREDLRYIEDLINTLSLDYQTVLRLHYFNGFSLVEIADILGISADTIKSQHRRALIKLKQILDNKKLNLSIK